MISRRDFILGSAATGAWLYAGGLTGCAREEAGEPAPSAPNTQRPEITTSVLPWWKKGVVYQIAVASFADSDGDGKGDLRGILEKLDYLNDGTSSSLGVDAIWLTPINASPMADFGYDISDYYSINPRFGTMRDFEELLAACHERGMKVMMDMVLNHTSIEHPWFVESCSSRDNPKRDWYIWHDGRAPGKPPNRWLAVVEGSAWEHDAITDQYYYHAFLPFQPDLNWRNPEVRQEMHRVIQFWLDKGVDGFRLDLINFLYEDASLRDNPRKITGVRPYFWQQHLYDRSRPQSLEEARKLRDLIDGYSDRAMMGEVYTDRPEDAVAYLGDGNDALNLSFYLDFAKRKWGSDDFRESVGWLEEHLPPGGWPCYYLSNHDLNRSYSRLGGGDDSTARAKVAAAMLIALRGTPIIYYGEEIGMPAGKVPRKRMDDPLGKKWWPIPEGRDDSRTPMQWNAGRNAGFTSGEPWLPVDTSYTITNVEAQEGEPESLLSWYRRLIRLRAQKVAVQAGSYRVIEDAPEGVYAYVREAGDERIAVLLNFTPKTVTIESQLEPLGPETWRALLSTHAVEGEEVGSSSIQLRPYEVLMLEPLSATSGSS